MIIVTVTCNSSGGQPVSMANLKAVKQMAEKYNVPVIFDSARFAENAYFIKTREEGYQHKSIREIVAEMFTYADGMTMSAKKDAIVNIGGFIALRDAELFRNASVFSIMFEGFLTYGGLAGRDLNALAQGLYEGTEYDYLHYRISQVAFLGQKLTEFGVPVQQPYGGHAIFVDASKVLSNVPKEQFRAQTLAVELYIEAGIRGVEIGAILADRDPVTRENRYPELELLRLAIPRRTYTNNHMNYVAVAMANVYNRRQQITTGLAIEEEAPILRHFTVKLRKI
jgi:tryptophanase